MSPLLRKNRRLWQSFPCCAPRPRHHSLPWQMWDRKRTSIRNNCSSRLLRTVVRPAQRKLYDKSTTSWMASPLHCTWIAQASNVARSYRAATINAMCSSSKTPVVTIQYRGWALLARKSSSTMASCSLVKTILTTKCHFHHRPALRV